MQLLLTKERPRTELRIVSHGACTVDELRCFGSGRVYNIRPLQRNISRSHQPEVKDEYEYCLSCLRSIPISDMQEHLEICSVHVSILSDMGRVSLHARVYWISAMIAYSLLFQVRKIIS